MNKYLSSKIKIISFICIIMVVFLHCYNFTDNFLLPQTTISEGLNIATFIEFFLCNGFTRIAVPIFFMISGYLFFLTYKLSIEKYFYKVKSRFLSLMIPYLIWSIIGIGLCYLLKNIDIMPINDMKTNYSDGGFFNVLYNPPNFQFWFIKQLFIYTILSPIIYLLVKYKIPSCIYFALIFIAWFLDLPFGPIIVCEALMFFSFGASLAVRDKSSIIMGKISKNKIIISLILWLVILCLKTVLAGIFTQDFIYCFHEPLLDIVIQYTLVFLANSFAFNLVTYFIYPTCAILIAILLSSILLKYAPSLRNILTGNRGTRRKK
ncbi:MAG: acyltransferase [Clostridiales bacterium]|nr:acyltransferase [Clostridiales bacterium]